MKRILAELAIAFVVVMLVWAWGFVRGLDAAPSLVHTQPALCLAFGGVIDGDQMHTVCLMRCREEP
jgi:hypothetical protein